MTSAPAWPDEQREVTVGPWRFALRGAELADVRHDDGAELVDVRHDDAVPVLRGIRFVTRDADWRTADDVVLDAATTAREHGGHLRVDASARFDDTEVLRWTLDASADGDTLHVDVTATVTAPFRRNRVGFVVLHPPTLAGVPLVVQHPDGTETTTAHPIDIAPHQPARDVAGYTWDTGRRQVRLDLGGDVFEMEDQRNWTDASYKTYSTPLAEPFPVDLGPGSTVRQTLTLRVTATGRTARQGGATPTRCIPRRGAAPFSATGTPVGHPAPASALPDADTDTDTATDTGDGSSAAPALQLLAGSGPAAERPADDALLRGLAVLVEPVLGDPDTAAVLAGARRDAQGAPLDVRFVTDDPTALRAAIESALADGPVVRVGAFHPVSHGTTAELQGALRRASAELDGLEVVAGTRAHFTELNRGIDDLRAWDGPLTFSVTPQMHDRSRTQVTESVRMQREVVRCASRLAAGRPLHVGPVTLRPRFNAVATSARRPVTDPTAAGGYGPETVPDATDPAQHGVEAGVWTAASVAALTAPGVASITLAEAWGRRGVVTGAGVRTPTALAIEMLR